MKGHIVIFFGVVNITFAVQRICCLCFDFPLCLHIHDQLELASQSVNIKGPCVV
jgi:hypothetical protein